MLFTGEYEHAIDEKQRLAIPAELRSRMQDSSHGKAFYAVPGPNGAVWLWPEVTFHQMIGAMEHELLPGEEVMDFEELLFTQAARLEFDKAGRVRLPERLLSVHGIGHQVVVLGVKDHIELRDPAAWKERLEQRLAKQGQIMLEARRALQRRREAERPA